MTTMVRKHNSVVKGTDGATTASLMDALMAEAPSLHPDEERAIRDGFEPIGPAWLKVERTGKRRWSVVARPGAAAEPVHAVEVNLFVRGTLAATVATIVEKIGPGADGFDL